MTNKFLFTIFFEIWKIKLVISLLLGLVAWLMLFSSDFHLSIIFSIILKFHKKSHFSLTVSLIFSYGQFTLVRIKIPQRDCVSRSMCRLNFMWVSSIWPEEGYSIENRFHIGHPIHPTRGINAQQTATLVCIPVDI